MKLRTIIIAVAILSVSFAGWLIVRLTSDRSSAIERSEIGGKYPPEATKKAKRSRSESGESKPLLPETVRRTSWLPQEGKLPELSDEQIIAFLENNHHSADALLAASRIKSNLDYLREAAQNFPNEKAVQLELAIRETTQEEKLAALERFRQLDPNNSYGDYLAGLFHYQQGNDEGALADLEKADSHTLFGFPVTEIRQPIEDAYLSAGYTPIEAKAAAVFGQPNINHAPLNQLAGYLSHSIAIAGQSGDAELVTRLLGSSLNLVRRVSGTSRLITTDMIGVVIETRVLKALPEDAKLPNTPTTVAQRLEQLQAAREDITSMAADLANLQNDMTESEFLKYLKRVENDGETEVLRELRDKATK